MLYKLSVPPDTYELTAPNDKVATVTALTLSGAYTLTREGFSSPAFAHMQRLEADAWSKQTFGVSLSTLVDEVMDSARHEVVDSLNSIAIDLAQLQQYLGNVAKQDQPAFIKNWHEQRRLTDMDLRAHSIYMASKLARL